MQQNISSENTSSRSANISFLRKGCYAAALLILLAVTFFAAFYLIHDYSYLHNWFLSLNDCFYRRDLWDKEFFTPDVRSKGTRYAVAAIGIAISGIIYILATWRSMAKRESRIHFTIPRSSIIWYSLVILTGIGLSIWGDHISSPAYDEIFSASNCAKLHPLQTLSYYMLPNNHIYFNLVNNILFHWVDDNVRSGRFISGVAYVALLCIAFHWFSLLFKNNALAFVALTSIALQFTVWGFGFQARGYEWHLLAAWVALASLFRYIRTNSSTALRINMLFSAIGFGMVATYLYFFVAQCMFLLLVQAYIRKFDFRFWKYQFFTICVVFLCYQPALCFSGLNAFINNSTIKSNPIELANYLPTFLSVFKYFINTCFSFIIREDHPLNFIIFLLPLLLLFARRKERKLFGLFYLTLWLVWMLMVLYTKMHPFCRSMIIHYSITLAFVIYTVYAVADAIANYLKKPYLLYVIFTIPVLLSSIHYYRGDAEHESYNLYFNDTDQLYSSHTRESHQIPKGSSIAFSEESFYFYYLLHKQQYPVKKCSNGNEDYYIKRNFETLDEPYKSQYTLLKNLSEGYELYKRKP
ncbi:MAG: hypothetical protein WCG87_09075 [Bacteroidota bacterium]